MKVISKKENLINLIPFISDHNSYSSLEENYLGFLECTGCHKVFGNIPLAESATFAFCPYCGKKFNLEG